MRGKVTYIAGFISHLHEMQYKKEMGFCYVELGNITTTDVEPYLILKAFGLAEIILNLEWLTLCCSNTLECIRKRILFFIPNWIPTCDPSNSTKSIDVNQLIEDVRKHEVCKEGAKPQVKWDLWRPELLKALNLFSDCNNFAN